LWVLKFSALIVKATYAIFSATYVEHAKSLTNWLHCILPETVIIDTHNIQPDFGYKYQIWCYDAIQWYNFIQWPCTKYGLSHMINCKWLSGAFSKHGTKEVVNHALHC